MTLPTTLAEERRFSIGDAQTIAYERHARWDRRSRVRHVVVVPLRSAHPDGCWGPLFPVVGRGAEDSSGRHRAFEGGLVLLNVARRREGVPCDLAVIAKVQNPGNTCTSADSPSAQAAPQIPSGGREQRPSMLYPGGAGQMEAGGAIALKPRFPIVFFGGATKTRIVVSSRTRDTVGHPRRDGLGRRPRETRDHRTAHRGNSRGA